MVDYLPRYDLPQIHELMLSDRRRVEAYKRAIEKNVEKGDIVLDVGTGTGILACFAAKAGGRVLAVDSTETVYLAKKIAKRNNLSEKIEFIKAYMEDIDIPKVDCIVSEWLGIFGVQENLLPLIAHARDSFLKSKGRMLPHKVSLYITLIEEEEFHYQLTRKWHDIYGLNLSDFADVLVNDMYILNIPKKKFLSKPQKIKDFNMYTANSSEFSITGNFRIERDGNCHGLGGWFKAEFPGDIILNTSPDNILTHWHQVYFPINKPLKVKRGDEIKVDFVSRVDEHNKRLIRFSKEVRGL